MKFILKLFALTIAAVPLLFSCKEEEIIEADVQVITLNFSSIGTDTATGSGYLTKGDAAAMAERGICWNTSADPCVNDARAVASGDASEHDFSVRLTGLTPNTHYYARAYVTDKATVHYGNPVEFSTKDIPWEGACLIEKITGITPSSATVAMTLASDGGNEITEIGVCYSLTASPTVDDTILFAPGGRDFSAELTDLAQNTQYHVRPYFKTADGRITYGEEAVFRTINFIVTKDPHPGYKTAYFFGETMKNESDPPIERGFCWSRSEKPSVEKDKFKMIGGTEGSFNLLATGFEKGGTYYVRAYAKNTSGTHYGEQMAFTTKTGSVLPGGSLEDMILVGKGSFRMGYSESATVPNLFSGKTLNTETMHSVTLTKDFYMNRYAVTNEQMCAFLNVYPIFNNGSAGYCSMIYTDCAMFNGGAGTRAYSFRIPWDGVPEYVPQNGFERAPANTITWVCSYEYCRWLSAELGVEVRQPTEAEWEYAARGGSKSRNYLYSGSDVRAEVAVTGSKPAAVGSLKPNELGLYDMSGNTFEYCADVYTDFFYKDGDVDPYNKNIQDLKGQPRCIRGGSFRHYNNVVTKDYQVVGRRGRAGHGGDCGNHSGMRIMMAKLPTSID